MISIREDGKSIAEIVGHHMGNSMLLIMRIFSVVLLVLVGTVAMTVPAVLLSNLLGVAATIILPCILLYSIISTNGTKRGIGIIVNAISARQEVTNA